MPQKCMECFRLLFDHLAWIKHPFLSGIRDLRKAGSLWGMMRDVGGVRKSIHQSWLAKGLRLLCWSFKGVQEEILSEEASTLQIGSVVFFTRTMYQSTTPSMSQTIWPRWASRQFLCPVGWGYRIHWLHHCRGVRSPNECPGYDTKQSDGEVPAILELWGMRVTPSLPLLPGPL